MSALAQMDPCCLTPHQVELLFLNAPPMEEVQMLREAQSMHEINAFNVWDTAEDFMLSLIQVPRFQLRLQVWDFENSFQESYDTFSLTDKDIAHGCTSLLYSERIR